MRMSNKPLMLSQIISTAMMTIVLSMALSNVAQAADCDFKTFSSEMSMNRYSQCSPRAITPGLGTITSGCDLTKLYDLMKHTCPSERLREISQQCGQPSNMPSCSTVNTIGWNHYCLRAYIQAYYASVKLYCDYLSVPEAQTNRVMAPSLATTPADNKLSPGEEGVAQTRKAITKPQQKPTQRSKSFRLYY